METSSIEHSHRTHALLSASGSHRWINCPPSALLEDQYPDSSSEAAEEGTAAHELAEHKLRTLLEHPTTRPESPWHNEEMESHTDDYADCVMAELVEAQKHDPTAFLAIEQRIDYSHLVPGGFGTGDATICEDGRLTIIDLKYGKGVEVTAGNNTQMRLYALGTLARFDMIYTINTVRMIIFQPRLGNTSIEEITVQELIDWGNTIVKPAAALAARGEGDLNAGAWCTFCKHKAQCPALAKMYLDPIPADTTPGGKFELPAPDTLTDAQMVRIVELAGEIKKWLTAAEKHALDQANNGKKYPGLKLVEGRSIRRYADEQAVIEAVQKTGHDPCEHKLLGVTAMTKMLGKKQFDELLGPLLHKPAGKPTLVPVGDKRPELVTATPQTVFTPIA